MFQLNFNTQNLKSVARATDEQPHKDTCSAHSQIDMSSACNGSSMLLPPVAPAPSNYPPSDVPREPEPVEKGDVPREPEPVEKGDASFVLPDLNLMPCEDDSCS